MMLKGIGFRDYEENAKFAAWVNFIVHRTLCEMRNEVGDNMGDKIAAALIQKTGDVYEIADRAGDILGYYRSWEPIALIFREADYSEEYIAKRKTEADCGFAEEDGLKG